MYEYKEKANQSNWTTSYYKNYTKKCYYHIEDIQDQV